MSLFGLLLVITLVSAQQFGSQQQGSQQFGAQGSQQFGAQGSQQFGTQQQGSQQFGAQGSQQFGSQQQGSFGTQQGTQQQGSFGTQQGSQQYGGSYTQQFGGSYSTQTTQTTQTTYQTQLPAPMTNFDMSQFVGNWYGQAQIASALPASIMGGNNCSCTNWVFSPMPDGTISLHANVRIGGARGPLISVTGLLSSVDRLTVGLLGLDLHLRSLISNLNQYGLLGGLLRTLGLNSPCYGNFGGLLGGILGGNGILSGVLGGNDGLLSGILGGNGLVGGLLGGGSQGGLLGGVLGGGQQGGLLGGVLGGGSKRDGAMADTLCNNFVVLDSDYSNYALVYVRADIGADASINANVQANVAGVVNANVGANVMLFTRSAVVSPIQISAYLRILNTLNLNLDVNLNLLSPIVQTGCWGY